MQEKNEQNATFILQRIKNAISAANDAVLADFLGVKTQLIRVWRSRNTLDYNIVISKCASMDLNWILNGIIGDAQNETPQAVEPTKSSVNKSASNNDMPLIREVIVTVDQRQEQQIQFVSALASAGYINYGKDPNYVEQLPTMSVAGLLPVGTYRGFEVTGDSMEPNIYSGDKVIARLWSDKKIINKNDVFVVVTIDDIVVKRVALIVENEAQYLQCWSDNTVYEVYNLPVQNVLELWKVEAIFRVGVRSKSRMEEKVDFLFQDYIKKNR